MILNRLEMFNFRQFIGHQTVEFSSDPEKNVTVLIGINTSGKTTIIRAFEWCLYNKNNFEDQILLNSDVRSQMNVGDTQHTWVSVTFTHNGTQYTLQRELKYVCNERRFNPETNEYEVSLNKKPAEDVSLEYLQQDGQTKTPIDRSDIGESINRVLPKDLSDYFFFGGERISGIANRTDLSKAVRGLMGLDILENARNHIRSVLKGFENSIDTSGDANAQKAKDALNTYKGRLQQLEEEQRNADSQMQYWSEKEKQYSAELAKSDIEQVKKAKIERDRIERALEATRKKLRVAVQDMVTAFNQRPYVFFGLPSINQTLEFLDSIKDEVEIVPSMEQVSIDYLIQRGFCICGTHLDPGSVPYQRVMAERKKLPPENLGSAAMNYKNKAEGYLAGSNTFLSTLEARFKDIRNLKRDIGNLLDEQQAQSALILDDTAAKAIEGKRKEAHDKYLEAKSDFEQAVRAIGSCQENIRNCENAIEKYAKSSKKNERIVRLIAYTQAVYEWLDTTYQAKEKTVRVQLQERVNSNFGKMYHGERRILIDEKYRVTYSDVKTEESDGLKAVKSFAFIASLVSMAKDKILDEQDMKLGQEYPIVMDAPFSSVDEIHIDNICRILPHTANQVIMAVMKKDWDYAVENLDQFVGRSYSISKDLDAEGHEIDTSSHIVAMEV